MNKTTWCTQFSDQECSKDNCCLLKKEPIKTISDIEFINFIHFGAKVLGNELSPINSKNNMKVEDLINKSINKLKPTLDILQTNWSKPSEKEKTFNRHQYIIDGISADCF